MSSNHLSRVLMSISVLAALALHESSTETVPENGYPARLPQLLSKMKADLLFSVENQAFLLEGLSFLSSSPAEFYDQFVRAAEAGSAMDDGLHLQDMSLTVDELDQRLWARANGLMIPHTRENGEYVVEPDKTAITEQFRAQYLNTVLWNCIEAFLRFRATIQKDGVRPGLVDAQLNVVRQAIPASWRPSLEVLKRGGNSLLVRESQYF